ncbi:MAG: sigma-70 family RNA polymerase sigma factor [Actinomycetota bacterium]
MALEGRVGADAAAEVRFRAVYDRALPVVYGFLVVRTGGDRALAEDLTGETFAAAAAAFRDGRADQVTEAWLRTVAKRRLIDHWRHETVARRRVVELADRRIVEPPDVAEQHAVVDALGQLSEDQRRALVLRHMDGHSVSEVAELLGRTIKATESLLSRARVAFRGAYEEVEVR